MKEIVEITFFTVLLIALLPALIYLWILCICEIKEKLDYYYNIKLENSELREQIILRDAEIHHLKEHIENT
jgi:TRAP-type uncharacterized transport system fused permease subunit